MIRTLRAGAALVALALSSLSSAAEICYSADQPAASATPPTNSTVFTCPTAGMKTLPQLAALGMRVVRLVPISTSNGTMIRQQLTVQPSRSIHRDGFE